MTPPDSLLGYHVVSTLVDGSGNATFKAAGVDSSGFVVIKATTIEPPSRSRAILGRLQRDLASVASISDPRLAAYRRCEFDERRLVVVRAWVPGLTLAQDARFGVDPHGARAAVSPDELVRFALGTLVALDALHVRGLACGRLSPTNIHVLPSGDVTLSDWTVRWPHPSPGCPVAPELRGGSEPDTRSDLWSVGAILYTLATGRRAREDGTLDLADCEGTLRGLLARLLALEPQSRPSSARHALREFEGHLVPSSPRAGVHRRLPRLLGRDTELADLSSALDRMSHGGSEFVFVRGGRGFGKTRLLGELARLASVRGIRMVRGAPAAATAMPLGEFAPCFDEIASDMLGWSSSERREVLQNDGRLLLEISPGFQLLGDLTSLKQPPRLGAEAARHRLLRAAARVIAASSRRRPMLLLLDDIHASDPLSLDLIRHLSRNVVRAQAPGSSACLAVVASFDPGLEGGRGVVASMVSALRIKGVAREIALKPLAPHEVRQLLSDVLMPVAPPVKFVARVLAETGSIPLQIEDLLRWLDDAGILGHDPEKWLPEWESACVKSDIRRGASVDDDDALSLILGNSGTVAALPCSTPTGVSVGRLSPGATRVAEVVAVSPGGIGLEVLRGASGLAPAEFDAAFAWLTRSDLLRETSPETIVLRHETLADGILAGIEAAGRRDIHSRIGAAVERLLGRLDQCTSLWLAYHFHEAGDVERSLLYLPLAARLLKERHAIQEALVMTRRFFRHLQALEPADRERHLGKRIQALQFSAEILAQLDRRTEAILTYREMGSLAENEGRDRDVICAWSGLAQLSAEAGDFETSADFARRVVDLARRHDQPGAVADALTVLGLTAMRRGRESEAVWDLSSALKIYRDQGPDPLGAARVLELIGDVYASRYRYQRSLAPYRRACDEYRAIDDKLGVAHCLDRLGRAHGILGNWSRALAFHRESLRLQREVDQPDRIGSTLDLLGDAFGARGDIEKAMSTYKESLALKRELADLRGSADTLLRLAHLDIQTGRVDDAQLLLDQALTVARRAGNQRAEAGTLVRCAQVQILRDDRSRAFELATDGLTRSRGCGDWMMECRAQIVLACCQAGAPALEAAAEAVRLASRIGSPGLNIRANATRGDVLAAAGDDEGALVAYCAALDQASALMSAHRGGANSGFLRRADIVSSLKGARDLVSRRYGASARERYPALAMAEDAELVSA